MSKTTNLFLLTLSLATGALPTKTPAVKKLFPVLQKEVGAVAKKVPQGVKQGFKKIGEQLEQKGGKKALQKTEASLLQQAEKQGVKTAEQKIVPKIVKNLTPAERRAIKGLEKQIALHRKKLANYISSPDKFDNKGFLKNAKTLAERNKIIKTRISKLEKQINTFKKDIKKIQNG